MYNGLLTLTELLSIVLQGWILSYFTGQFMQDGQERWRGCRHFMGAAWILGRIAVRIWTPGINDGLRPLWKLVVLYCLLLLSFSLLYRGSVGYRLYLSVVFMAFHEISFFLAYMIIVWGNSIFDLYLWYFLRADGPVISDKCFLFLMQATEFLLLALEYAVFTLLLFLCVRRFVKKYREKDSDMGGTELLFLGVPAMTGVLICVLLRIIVVTVKDGIPELLYDNYPLLKVIVPVILLLCLKSILCSVGLWQDMIVLNREKGSRMVMEQQVRSMQEHMQEMNRTYAHIRGMKHDMKNQLAVMHELVRQRGDGEEKQQELTDWMGVLERTMDSLEPAFKTGNMVADAVLHMKFHEAAEKMPKLTMDADGLIFPKGLQIDNYDMTVILCNALDNALEACGRLPAEDEKWIRIFSFQRGRLFFLQVENSFNGCILCRDGREFPATNKEDRKMHGIGFLNMQASAEKYCGGVDWRTEGKTFVLSIMLKSQNDLDKVG